LKGIPVARLLAALSILMAFHASASAQPSYGTRVVCPLILAPVCGQKAEETRTFANKCMAERQGFVVIRSGSCDGTPRSQLKLLP
jgi:hypothetical protein